MRVFKQVDLALQIVFGTLLIISFLAFKNTIQIIALAISISWQAVSLVIHHHKHWFAKKRFSGASSTSFFIICILIVVAPFCMRAFPKILFLVPLLSFTLYYLYMSYMETRLLFKRPLSYLK